VDLTRGRLAAALAAMVALAAAGFFVGQGVAGSNAGAPKPLGSAHSISIKAPGTDGPPPRLKGVSAGETTTVTTGSTETTTTDVPPDTTTPDEGGGTVPGTPVKPQTPTTTPSRRGSAQ
jgi:hypothetical protein